MNRLLLLVLILSLLAGCAEYAQPEGNEDGTQAENTLPEAETESVPATGATKVFVLTGEHLKFIMDGKQSPELHVQEGDRVRIEFISTQGFHDWVVDEFNAKTKQVPEGQSTSVEFIADKKGTFEYYCSVGKHRANGMFGNLIVE